VLDAERQLHGQPVEKPAAPKTAWEHSSVGRALLRAGRTDAAATEIAAALQQDPYGLWPNFYSGVCSYRRGRYADAVAAFGVCIGAEPNAAGGYCNRALALLALGRKDEARRDYDRARQLDPQLSISSLDVLPNR
jgi:tetratricopeptide (TPR) repeat protein